MEAIKAVAAQAISSGKDTDKAQAQQLKVARDFEAILLRKMLSGLEKTSRAKDAPMAAGADMYTSMMVGVLADSLAAAGGLGLSNMIAQTLDPHRMEQPASPQSQQRPVGSQGQLARAKALPVSHVVSVPGAPDHGWAGTLNLPEAKVTTGEPELKDARVQGAKEEEVQGVGLANLAGSRALGAVQPLTSERR